MVRALQKLMFAVVLGGPMFAACKSEGARTETAPSPAPAARVDDDGPRGTTTEGATVGAGSPSEPGAETLVGDETSATSPRFPKPELVETDTWPFVQWDHAKAYVFNLEIGPQLSLYAYNASKGWNTRIDSEHALTPAQAETAVTLAEMTQGEMLVSKCPMPRHAVVLFSGETPVASINVCFECGDILVWPRWRRDPRWPEKKQDMHASLMKAYDRAFPKWETFFGKTLGLDLDPAKVGG